MKALVLSLLVLTVSSQAHAESRTYKKINSSEAVVTIHTDEKDGTQAMLYNDGKENDTFIQDLLTDKSSAFYKASQNIILEYCGKTEVTNCGNVTLTESIRTAFGRAGWMETGSVFTSFLGFTHEGSGRYFGVDYQIEVTEEVAAQVNADDQYNGIVKKHLSATIKKIVK